MALILPFPPRQRPDPDEAECGVVLGAGGRILNIAQLVARMRARAAELSGPAGACRAHLADLLEQQNSLWPDTTDERECA